MRWDKWCGGGWRRLGALELGRTLHGGGSSKGLAHVDESDSSNSSTPKWQRTNEFPNVATPRH